MIRSAIEVSHTSTHASSRDLWVESTSWISGRGSPVSDCSNGEPSRSNRSKTSRRPAARTRHYDLRDFAEWPESGEDDVVSGRARKMSGAAKSRR